ncbi:hypothetical protein RirG_051820 [Rhizophagus irregularis DAOM 197198w]|uniref:Uncharacterized protein n=1 Tax=Rhizophagus irregularis (strain DAOM 197198w) TaxID=1432141 RepID=A0A015K418_RHIIW|nr:hypothetical protein RirG_051820 [Rhizophagus irregularis DAOM 197198w]
MSKDLLHLIFISTSSYTNKGFAQVTEMDSSLSRKRKANEIDDEYDMDKSMGDCKRCGKIILHGMYTRR